MWDAYSLLILDRNGIPDLKENTTIFLIVYILSVKQPRIIDLTVLVPRATAGFLIKAKLRERSSPCPSIFYPSLAYLFHVRTPLEMESIKREVYVMLLTSTRLWFS
jgi:hypothetical protein